MPAPRSGPARLPGVVTAQFPGSVSAADTGDPRRWAITTVLGAVAFIAQLDFFIVNVVLDGIGKSFAGSPESLVSWVLSAYAVVFAAVLVPAGRLADQYGRKKVLLGGVALFTAASAFAPALGVLIGARRAGGRRRHDRPHVPEPAVPQLPRAPAHAGGRHLGRGRGHRRVRGPAGRLPDAASGLAVLFGVSLLVLATVEGSEWGWERTHHRLVHHRVFAAVTLQRTLRAESPVVEKELLFRSRQFTAATIALLLYFTGFSVFPLGGALFMQ